MTDPFAFMGTTRGAGRTGDEPREQRVAPPVFEVPSDLGLVRAAWLLLDELNGLSGPRRSDAVTNICRYYGFECPLVTRGLWALRYEGHPHPVAYLHEGSRFDLFILVERVKVA